MDPSSLYREALIGWRSWKAMLDPKTDKWVLSSIAYPHTADAWPPRRPGVAKCSQALSCDPHKVPTFNHTCGYYLFKDLRTSIKPIPSHSILAYTHIGGNYDPLKGNNRVYGRCSMWGKIIECEEGYRAQYVYPYEIFVPQQEFTADGSAGKNPVAVVKGFDPQTWTAVSIDLVEPPTYTAEEVAKGLRDSYLCDTMVIENDRSTAPGLNNDR